MKIGIDIGGSHTAIAVINNNNTIISKQQITYNSIKFLEKTSSNKKITDTNLIKFIEKYIIEKVNEISSKYDIEKIGIAVPGIIDGNIIVKSPNLKIEKYNLVEALRSKINIKKDYQITLINDAKAAAIAENEVGCLKESNRSIFLTLGTGIGGAVIINNKLLDTGKYQGVEVGHMVIEKDGIECNCGNKGCFEKYASMKVLKENLREYLIRKNIDSMKETITTKQNSKNKEEKNVKYDISELNSRKLQEILEQNEKYRNEKNIKYDKNIEKIIEEYIHNLSIGIGNLVNIFEPERIGIGGSFCYFENILLEKLRKNLKEGSYIFNKQNKIEIVIGKLGNTAGIIGSAI